MEAASPFTQEEQFQENLKIANKAKEAYWHQYQGLVSNLSLEHLDDFAKILKADNVTFNKEVLLKDFQENLAREIIQSMEKSWDMCNIGDNISTLEMMKDKFKNRLDPNWRPYGKSVDEQTLPIRMHRLEAKRRYLKRQIDFQNAKLEEVLKHNEMYRNEVIQISSQRSFMRDQMHRGTAELQNLKTEYKKMIEQTLDKD